MIPEASGRVLVDGRPVRLGSSTESVRRGLLYIPADRHRDGLFPVRSISDNLSSQHLGTFSRRGRLQRGAERSLVARLADIVALRVARFSALVPSLSGGNQQKVVLARCNNPSGQVAVVLMHEPTAGVDVAARREIHDWIRALAAGGVAVLLMSTDAEELALLSHRVITFYRGAPLRVRDQHGTVDDLVRDIVADTTHAGVATTSTTARPDREPSRSPDLL